MKKIFLTICVVFFCIHDPQGRAANASPGTWTPFPNQAPVNIDMALLLTDGTLMCHQVYAPDGVFPRREWYRLTPDAFGNYLNGTWTQLASMHDSRYAFGSAVLRDGRVLVAGGEYGTGLHTMEIYDPRTNVWTPVALPEPLYIADANAKVLPNGKVLLLPTGAIDGEILDPVTGGWLKTKQKLYQDPNPEESAVLLPDGSVLMANVLAVPYSQRYLPWSNQWVSAGAIPVPLVDPYYEIGPGVLLYDGRVFFLGATGNTAFYTPTATGPGIWQQGPIIPNGLAADDVPAAVMPNGRVLFVADIGHFYYPSTFFEYDPGTNSILSAQPPFYELTASPAFPNAMLVLPTGQILVSHKSAQLYVYNPAGGPNPAWRPTIASITLVSNGVYRLTGTQLNGLTEGAYFGDDLQTSTNYPLVCLINASGRMYYARTSNFSTMGLATGNAPVSTTFSVSGIPAGYYWVQVVTNGIASNSVFLNLTYSDFNRDGVSDILLQNSANNALYILNMSGANGIARWQDLYSPRGTGWHWKVVGMADFDSDGIQDILIQNSDNNALYIFNMNGADGFSRGQSLFDPGRARWPWKVVGIADFNRNGIADILLQNTDNNALQIVNMNGADGILKRHIFFDMGGTRWPWKVVGIGDFNGDGIQDIVLQNSDNNAIYIMNMDGVGGMGYGRMLFDPANNRWPWKVVGVADFNSDGIPDILIQNQDNFAIHVFDTDGADGILQKNVLFDPPFPWAWKVVAITDFNKDGIPDILVQHSVNYALCILNMNGANRILNWQNLFNPSTYWPWRAAGIAGN